MFNVRNILSLAERTRFKLLQYVSKTLPEVQGDGTHFVTNAARHESTDPFVIVSGLLGRSPNTGKIDALMRTRGKNLHSQCFCMI